MELTRYEHACTVFDLDGRRPFIDPGNLTRSLADVSEVVAIVITHEHADHWTDEQLTALRAANPAVRIVGPAGVVLAASGHPVERVDAGDTLEVEGFRLEFFGSKHAVIHSSIPIVDNVGVLVNGAFYYGGDSYTVPGTAVEVLAAPCGAPWLKIGEAMDYVLEVAPRLAFAVHDAPLSPFGLGMHRARLRWATEQAGGEFIDLEAGETLAI